MKHRSLAEFVIQSFEHGKQPHRKMLWPLAALLRQKGRLPGVKQFVYDQKTQDILDSLQQIPIADFIAQFDRIVLPFDSLWIETASPETFKPASIQRKGFLLNKTGNGSITGRYALELGVPGSSEPERAQGAAIVNGLRFYVRDNCYVLADDEQHTFSKAGIHIDSSRSIATIVEQRLGVQTAKIKNKTLIAEDIFRLMVLVSSRNVRARALVSESKTTQDQGSTDRFKAPQNEIVLTPITVDLTTRLARAIRQQDDADIKRLLGWTDVMRHRRIYHTRQGPVEKIIEPHDRRIAQPIDRRQASRLITISDSAALDLTGKRPAIKRSHANLASRNPK